MIAKTQRKGNRLFSLHLRGQKPCGKDPVRQDKYFMTQYWLVVLCSENYKTTPFLHEQARRQRHKIPYRLHPAGFRVSE